MSQKEIAIKIEEVMINAEMAHSLQNTLFVAFYSQEEYSIKDFECAFSLLGNLTFSINNELKKLTNELSNNIT
ncbi:MAG: hypothetical protein K1W16_12770 [Lachnospiraceae bacterium]